MNNCEKCANFKKRKKMVKKIYERWVNIYKDGVFCLHLTKHDAIKNRKEGYLGEPYHIVHEYWAEED